MTTEAAKQRILEQKREWWRRNRGQQYTRQEKFFNAIDDPLILETLNEQEKAIVIAYFGLGGDFKNLAEVGRDLGVSRQRMNAVKQRLIRKLKIHLPV